MRKSWCVHLEQRRSWIQEEAEHTAWIQNFSFWTHKNTILGTHHTVKEECENVVGLLSLLKVWMQNAIYSPILYTNLKDQLKSSSSSLSSHTWHSRWHSWDLSERNKTIQQEKGREEGMNNTWWNWKHHWLILHPDTVGILTCASRISPLSS